MGSKTVTNPTGAFGQTDLQTEVGSTTVPMLSTGAITTPAAVFINTTGNGIITALTNGTPSLCIGIAIGPSLVTNGVGLVVTGGMAENVPCTGTVAAGDLLKPSATTAGYVSATATPAVGEVVGRAINASASNTVDVWVAPSALS